MGYTKINFSKRNLSAVIETAYPLCVVSQENILLGDRFCLLWDSKKDNPLLKNIALAS